MASIPSATMNVITIVTPKAAKPLRARTKYMKSAAMAASMQEKETSATLANPNAGSSGVTILDAIRDTAHRDHPSADPSSPATIGFASVAPKVPGTLDALSFPDPFAIPLKKHRVP